MVEFLGIGSAFNTKLGNTSAFIKEGDHLFLIDCGSNIFDRILSRKILEGIDKVTVFVTHTHADHVGSLADFIFYTFFSHGEICKKNITIMSPLDTKVKEVLELMGCYENVHYDYVDVQTNTTYECGAVHFSPIQTVHYPKMNSYALSMDYKGKKIFYSGDAAKISYAHFDIHQYDIAYIDTSKAHFEGNPHLSLEELTAMISKNNRHKVWCMHLDAAFDRNEAEGLGFHVVKEY